MFDNAELLTAINADEVIAVGAANQASLIMDKDTLEFNQMNETGTITVHATTHAIVYCLPNEDSINVLIPANCPIPVRRSHHLALENEDKFSVKLFLQTRADKSLLDLAEVCITICRPLLTTVYLSLFCYFSWPCQLETVKASLRCPLTSIVTEASISPWLINHPANVTKLHFLLQNKFKYLN